MSTYGITDQSGYYEGGRSPPYGDSVTEVLMDWANQLKQFFIKIGIVRQDPDGNVRSHGRGGGAATVAANSGRRYRTDRQVARNRSLSSPLSFFQPVH